MEFMSFTYLRGLKASVVCFYQLNYMCVYHIFTKIKFSCLGCTLTLLPHLKNASLNQDVVAAKASFIMLKLLFYVKMVEIY